MTKLYTPLGLGQKLYTGNGKSIRKGVIVPFIPWISRKSHMGIDAVCFGIFGINDLDEYIISEIERIINFKVFLVAFFVCYLWGFSSPKIIRRNLRFFKKK